MTPYCQLQLGSSRGKTKVASGRAPHLCTKICPATPLLVRNNSLLSIQHVHAAGGRNPNWQDCVKLDAQPGTTELYISVRAPKG